ncbi:MAG: 50S ribosomal protein L13 [Gammaproteobacteria bacterium]|nr:MAG: 50S ribosomal protein L13 [Gammaproteobacteria bacterium]|tara:strand:+ start:3148 stop:3576 length:429 start_codon:yes stop_codon:yes gene_type:complete
MNTQSFTKEDIKQDWILIDAKDKTLGRLATKIAIRLRGKHKPEFSPNADLGDYVVVINSDFVNITGDKLKQKKYYRHTGFPGGIKEKSLGKVLEETSEEAIRSAVKGMLPKNKLGRQILKKLKVYKDDTHPHNSQKPQFIDL